MAGFTSLALGAGLGLLGGRALSRRRRQPATVEAQPENSTVNEPPQPTENTQVPDAPDANREASEATREARQAAFAARRRARGQGNVRRRPRSGVKPPEQRAGASIGRPRAPRAIDDSANTATIGGRRRRIPPSEITGPGGRRRSIQTAI